MSLRTLASRTLAAALLLALAGPALAQLAPGSPWQNTKYDFLNLYQGTTTVTLKPEILMLLDDTGSTSRLMFHPLFPNNWQDEAPPNNPSGSNSADYAVLIKFSSYPTSSSIYPTGLSVGFTQNGNYTVGTVQASGKTYTIGGTRKLVTVNGVQYPTNTLIKPDGTEVTYNDVPSVPSSYVNSTVNGKKDPCNYMLCASHMRLECTYNGVTRDVDFPLSFVPLDATATLSNGTTGPLTPATAYDPVGTAYYQFDTESQVNVDSMSSPSVCYMDGNFYSNGYVRSRYIEWVLWGQDPNSTSGAAYCIPNAIPATSSAPTYAIDPTTLSYNGANGVWQYTGYTNSPATTFNNLLPNRTRGQAIKECVIKSWLANQTSCMLALRTFADTGTSCSNSISTTATLSFGSTSWIYMDPTKVSTQVPAFAAQTWSNGDSTPLTASTLSALCQLTNPAAFSTLIASNGYTQAQLQCQHHFLIILTDGAPNENVTPTENASTDFPYYQTISPNANPALTGNAIIKTGTNANNLTSNAASTGYWNIGTLAGMAAHGGEGSTSNPTWIRNPLTEGLTGSLTTLTSGSGWAPLWVTQRTVSGSAFTLTQAQAIQTMTVGVSLGVDYYSGSSGTNALPGGTAPNLNTRVVPLQTDTQGSKFRLLGAATFGDPAEDTYNIVAAQPFYLNTGSTVKPPDASYFFDGRDPTTLVNNLLSAFQQVEQISTVNSTSAPVFPTVGAGTGNEVYVATFTPPVNPGPLWTGDVLMYPTQISLTTTSLLDVNGNPITGNLTASNAAWSAAAALATRGWLGRRIYSRLPSTSAAPTPAILGPFVPGSAGNYSGDANYTAIQPYLPGGNAAAQLSNWQFFVGADPGSGTIPLGTRGTLMGDIIDSTPTALQYTTMPSSVSTVSSTLGSAWGSKPSPTFRMIFFGDNQGLMHAFGEVSWVTYPAANPTTPVAQAVVDELWAFAPTELLSNIDQLRVSTNKHYYANDGPPAVYLLDLPQSSTQSVGNGVYNNTTGSLERAILVFGLGKGGRSYYAINLADPANPTLQWTLCPNEQYNLPAARVLGGSSAVISKMGLATSQPVFARVATSKEVVTNQIIDAVLLGGGYSDVNIEGALPTTAVTATLGSMPAKNTLLGRSVVAMDVYNGNVLATFDISTTSGAGPVPTAAIPMELVSGAGIISRAYFNDYYGSLWALGGTTYQASPYTMFRVDTPILDNWGIRQVYTQPVTAGNAGSGLLTTSPQPFLINNFPVTRTTAPLVTPSAVGIAFVTGDRNNPLDNYTYTPWSTPTSASPHRLNVVFDRQDYNTTITNSGMDNASNSTPAAPLNLTHDLNNGYYGWYINFPGPSGGFVPKGISPPILLSGSVFYSYFNPTSATCAGGTGTTSTFDVCNVMAPIANSAAAASATAVNGCQSGLELFWTGVASNLTAPSVLLAIQAGLTSGSGTNNVTTNPQNLTLQSLLGNSSDRYPKLRLWRVVH